MTNWMTAEVSRDRPDRLFVAVHILMRVIYNQLRIFGCTVYLCRSNVITNRMMQDFSKYYGLLYWTGSEVSVIIESRVNPEVNRDEEAMYFSR